MNVAFPPPPVGIMQGRLSPPVGGRIQSFPVQTWADEFPRAREAGLASIECIYEGGGGTVPLGTGAADFAACFRAFAKAGLRFPVILQVARGETGDEVAWAIRNRQFVEERAAAAARASV